VPLQTPLWAVQVDNLTLVVDTGIGKAHPPSQRFDPLDNPVLERFAAADFEREQVDYFLLTPLHVDHAGWKTRWQED